MGKIARVNARGQDLSEPSHPQSRELLGCLAAARLCAACFLLRRGWNPRESCFLRGSEQGSRVLTHAARVALHVGLHYESFLCVMAGRRDGMPARLALKQNGQNLEMVCVCDCEFLALGSSARACRVK